MEKWYLPITIIPAVGLLLISTSNLINGLSQEIAQMIKDKNPRLEDIIEMKITQLGRLNRAMVGFYISAACLVLASFFSGLLTNAMINHKVYMFAFWEQFHLYRIPINLLPDGGTDQEGAVQEKPRNEVICPHKAVNHVISKKANSKFQISSKLHNSQKKQTGLSTRLLFLSWVFS